MKKYLKYYFTMAALALRIVSTGCENKYQAQQLKIYQDSIYKLNQENARLQKKIKSLDSISTISTTGSLLLDTIRKLEEKERRMLEKNEK